MRLICMLLPLLLLGSIIGATHVNISIAQRTITNPAGVTYVDGQAPADLKAGPFRRRYQDFKITQDEKDAATESEQVNEERSARLQTANAARDSKFGRYEDESGSQRESGYVTYSSSRNIAFNGNGRSARIQLPTGDNGGNAGDVQLSSERKDAAFVEYQNSAGGFSSGSSSQLRQPNEQEKSNLEFERYIQRHHSRPSVETVFETANTASQRIQQPPAASSFSSSSSTSSSSSASSNLNGRPSLVRKFERQVALPVASSQLLPNAEVERHNIKPVVEPSQENIVSASATNQAGGSNYPEKTALEQGSSYDKSKFEQSNYNVQAQYPPAVSEAQPVYGGYGGNDQAGYYGSQQQAEFYPSQSSYQPQQPVVTKTIQIAQPALKAKKFEVRHPAIQKEFYDIEERVLIKPAGTVVVELNHPVAKIPKGETILPLGQPHPAVASAYQNNITPSASQHQVSGASSFNSAGGGGGSGSASRTAYNPQYNPVSSNQFAPKPFRESTTLGSSISSTPNFDNNARAAAVEATLSGQRGHNFVYANPERRPQQQSSFSSNQLESNYNNQLNFYNANNNNNNENDQYKAEYIDSGLASGQGSNRDSFKPARLSETPAAPTETMTHIIKHEHNIHLPPSQHNIFLGRLEQGAKVDPEQKTAQLRSGRYEEEAARVLEIKPFSYNQRESGVVYSSNSKRPSAKYTDSGTTSLSEDRDRDQYRGQLRASDQHRSQVVQYSAPYSKMRQNPDQSARLQLDKFYLVENSQPSVSSFAYERNTAGDKANLRVEDDKEETDSKAESKVSSADESTAAPLKTSSDNFASNTVQHEQTAHIHIQIPQSSGGKGKSVVISSTISPPPSHESSAQYRSSSSSSSFASNIDEPQETERSGRYRSYASSPTSNTDEPVYRERSARYRSPTSVSSSSSSSSSRYSGTSNFIPASNQERSGKYRIPSDNFARAYVDETADVQDFRSAQYTNERRFGNLESAAPTKPDCDNVSPGSGFSARYETVQAQRVDQQQQQQPRNEQKFLRLVESNENTVATNAESSSGGSAQVNNAKANELDATSPVNSANSQTGQSVSSRVIASSPAPTDTSSHSESFHKRRIVVNHPFQTVREVVEHEPYTNYHQIQVNEAAAPALYRAAYIQTTHGALRQAETGATNGRLQYVGSIRGSDASDASFSSYKKRSK